jgi:hypothetical protein
VFDGRVFRVGSAGRSKPRPYRPIGAFEFVAEKVKKKRRQGCRRYWWARTNCMRVRMVRIWQRRWLCVRLCRGFLLSRSEC